MKTKQTKLNTSSNYLSLDINTLNIGDIITFDIYINEEDNYKIAFEAGTPLSEDIYSKLKQLQKLYLDKEDEKKQIFTCQNLKSYIRSNRDNPEKRVRILYKINNQLFDLYLADKDNKIDKNCVELIVNSIVYLIKYDEIFIKNSMPYLRNDYLLNNHSLHVTMYALALGYMLNFSNEKLLKLGIAALLHDVGLKNIDDKVIYKKAKLTPDECKMIQKHTEYSIDILKQNSIDDPQIIETVMHHHERYDKKGYPKKLGKEEISDSASILAICDVFDALTNSRPYRKAYKSFEALRMMMRDSDMTNQFNQKYLQMSIKLL